MSKEVFKLVINGVKVVMLEDGTFTIDSPQQVDVSSRMVEAEPAAPQNARKEFIRYISGPYTHDVTFVQQALNRLHNDGHLAFNRRPIIAAGNDVWLVKSGEKDEYYVVYKNGERMKCSCPSFYYHHRNGGQCKHIGFLVAQGVI